MQCTIEPASDKKFIKIRNCSLYNYIIAFSDTYDTLPHYEAYPGPVLYLLVMNKSKKPRSCGMDFCLEASVIA